MNHQTDLQAHLDSLGVKVVELENKIVPGISEALEIALLKTISATRNEIASVRNQLAAQSQGIIIELIFSWLIMLVFFVCDDIYLSLYRIFLYIIFFLFWKEMLDSLSPDCLSPANVASSIHCLAGIGRVLFHGLICQSLSQMIYG